MSDEAGAIWGGLRQVFNNGNELIGQERTCIKHFFDCAQRHSRKLPNLEQATFLEHIQILADSNELETFE